MDAILADVFDKLKIMLRWIVQRRVRSNRVWRAALNCLMMHAVVDGVPDRGKLDAVDARVYCCILRHAGDLSEPTENLIVTCLLNRLYAILSILVYSH